MMSARPICIRPETNGDAPAIEEVTAAAFMNAEHSNHKEQFIIRGLREANQLPISLVAEDEIAHTIVGHVAVSPVHISNGSENWYGLGPISVLPQYQGNGIGSLLMERALADLQACHAAGCVVLGNPTYYTRFGFKADPSLQMRGVPPEYFMALTWHKQTPTGTVSYHKAFEAPAYFKTSSSYNILVTGSAGHLGTALMLTLPGLGFRPLGIDILPSPTTTHVGSISDRAFIASIFDTNPIKHILHAATLHKPHVCSHSKEQFISTNIVGTLILLEESSRFKEQIESFIFFSTTSAFGMALSPKPGNPAAWIDESVLPEPKNIYGVTKVAAEDMCALMQKQSGIPVLVLRTSRFFPEEDDDEDRRAAMSDENLKVLELAYRRCDIEDIVSASVCAMKKAKAIRWGKYIISAPPPFNNNAHTLDVLNRNPAEVVTKIFPDVDVVFKEKGWKHLARIDRVYDSSKAVKELGWNPKYTFGRTVDRLVRGEQWKSDLTVKVGTKGYHTVSTGVYTKR
ncbi:hypothetical protein BGW36DRAFT_388636 [Talaromyces proteolyticus]|uniref:N-acetyltransferase domain-containing protein n=1 Tax=Talaromyces proteolyticus TaxID=1131652 RepID=A0AAD4KGI6_9EURO|nr:uncharacterized protein BGW36DRAFT_388636 [Talaromyces proteolyticus]KAH8691604.1 hypothetical protein BGW36DRAFT_388636 [Talaromyces proteolyticus]